MDGNAALHRPRLPAGFNESSYEALRRAVLIARQQGRDERGAAREVARGQHPGLSMPLIHDAAEHAVWGIGPG